MPVAYNSNLIIPAPTATTHREMARSEDGTPLSPSWVITLRGKLFANKGSPKNDGSFWNQGGGTYPPDETPANNERLTYLLNKQQALVKLFGTDGLTFEFMMIFPDATAPVKCYPKVRDIQFDDGPWFDYCNYTITLETEQLWGARGPVEPSSLTQYIQRAAEDWSLEAADDIGRTYRLTHTINATGRRAYSSAGDGSLQNSKQAWENAQDWVLSRLGLDTARLNPAINSGPSQGGSLANYPSLSAFNFLRAEHVNEMAGTYSVTETWLCFDVTGLAAPAVEDYTLNTRIDETGRTHATLEGTVRGLEVRDNVTHSLTSTRFNNAVAYFNSIKTGLFNRVQGMVVNTLNPTPLNVSEGANFFTGVLTYNYEFNDRPLSLLAGSIWETIHISTDNPVDVMAQIAVPGRGLGPVVQDMLTKSGGHKTVTFEAQLVAANVVTGAVTTAPNTDSIMALFAPLAANLFYVEKDVPNFEPTTGKYNRTTTWFYE